ncbi:hypothetical protein PS874_06300 [Pseudomonas fluorescens]|nr:hypothetical protein PS874_06300 [Pseudomonas fluorescens]
MPTTTNHPLLKFLATLPQFHTKLLDGAVLDMRSGAVVFKHDGGDEPKYQNTLTLRWPGQEPGNYAVVDGEKYGRLQVKEAAQLGASEDALLQQLEKALS